MPQGFWMAASNRSSGSGSKPSLVMSSISLSRSSRRSTIFSPNSVGSTDTRKSSSFEPALVVVADLDAPSCGRRFSAMSSFDMILSRDAIASRNFIDGFMTL